MIGDDHVAAGNVLDVFLAAHRHGDEGLPDNRSKNCPLRDKPGRGLEFRVETVVLVRRGLDCGVCSLLGMNGQGTTGFLRSDDIAPENDLIALLGACRANQISNR